MDNFNLILSNDVSTLSIVVGIVIILALIIAMVILYVTFPRKRRHLWSKKRIIYAGVAVEKDISNVIICLIKD